MKKALVMTFVLVLGLGVLAFAGPLTGSWEASLSIVPTASLITALDTTLTVDYAIGGWTFGSASTFDLTGFTGQSFTADGVLGAFMFSTTMNFAPMAVTEWTWPVYAWADFQAAVLGVAFCDLWVPTATLYEPIFLDWTAEGSVSIAGVNLSVLFFLDASHFNVTNIGNWFTYTEHIQSDSVVCTALANGSGSRFTLSGSFGGATITSYTYFNLSEKDVSTKYCPAVGKSGSYKVANDGCVTSFYEEYLMIEGFSFACTTIDMAVSIGCTGFNDVTFVVSGISIGGWLNLDFGLIFGVDSKTVDLCMSLVGFDVDCFTIEIGLGSANYVTGYTIDSISVHGIGIDGYDLGGGVTFSAYTELDIYSSLFSGATSWTYLYGPELAFLVPWFGTIACDETFIVDDPCDPCVVADVWDYGWSLECWSEYRYRLWEEFVIDFDADSCCGGVFDFTISTYFGDKEELTGLWYAIYFAESTVPDIALPFVGLVPDEIGEGTDYELDDPAENVTVIAYPTYDTPGVQDTLFAWAQTVVEASLGIGSNIALTFGFDISAFGWESLDFGFEFTF